MWNYNQSQDILIKPLVFLEEFQGNIKHLKRYSSDLYEFLDKSIHLSETAH